ncbi:MAG: glycoside hydrolase family 3 N-terminal domain-containing protein [Rikenellaceae bacterium]
MKTTIFNFLKGFILLLSLTFSSALQAKEDSAAIEKKIQTLLKKMTIEEKVGQLLQPYLTNESIDSIENAIKNGRVGSLLTTKRLVSDPNERNRIQKIAIDESRLGIPLFFGFDVIHGFRTLFPNPLGMASSWDDDLISQTAAVSAKEARTWGIDMVFSPMVDVARDPRWGRISECAGEDVLLNSRVATALIKGYQGDDMSQSDKVAACIKHFVGGSTCLGGRDKSFNEISRRSLHDTYLPPFKAAVDAGCMSIMVTFNDISGIPIAIDHYAMTQVVKEQWGFQGIHLSDWDVVVELQNHGVASSEKEAAELSFNAGMDVEMKSGCFDNIDQLVKEKKVDMKRLDDAVARVLRIKFMLGLFENPYVDAELGHQSQLTDENRALARKAAAESMILLKNDGVLPLDAKTTQISVVGPMAHNRDLLGYWLGDSDYKDVVTIYDGIKNNAPKNVAVDSGTSRSRWSQTTIVCVGERGLNFGESRNRHEIELSPSQVEYIKEMKKISTKLIVLVASGTPLVLTPIVDIADAIVQVWHPGTEAGNAVADVLFGKVNPSGKTTCSFVKATGQIPIFYSDRLTGRPRVNTYVDIDSNPLFPFGYGLSYTTFDYSNFKLSDSSMPLNGGKIIASVTVTNSGKVKGKEVVQLYIHDKISTVTQPKKRLIDYKKVEINPCESKEVVFEVTPEQLTLFDADCKEVTEKGEFDIWVGGSSESLLSSLFEVR